MFLGACVFGTGFLASLQLKGLKISLRTVAVNGFKIDPEPLTLKSTFLMSISAAWFTPADFDPMKRLAPIAAVLPK